MSAEQFVVTWTINIDGKSAEDAARQSLEIMRDPESTATIFSVQDVAGRRTALLDVGDPNDAILLKVSADECESDDPALNARYIAAAGRLHARDNDLEIDGDAKVSIGDDDGAYVQAWVWVPKSELGDE